MLVCNLDQLELCTMNLQRPSLFEQETVELIKPIEVATVHISQPQITNCIDI